MRYLGRLILALGLLLASAATVRAPTDQHGKVWNAAASAADAGCEFADVAPDCDLLAVLPAICGVKASRPRPGSAQFFSALPTSDRTRNWWGSGTDPPLA